MTRERLAAACLLPSFDGLTPPDWILRLAERGLGGVVLFARNMRDPEQVGALTGALPGLLVATDEEGGDVTRLEARTGSSYPGNAALGAVDDPTLTRDVAAAIGSDLAAVGINVDLAPVADVNTDPLNPVIGVRSFGSDAARVAAHVPAFVEGLQSRGVAACAKHFPGHGATRQDSHLELPTVDGDHEAGLEPFRAAIAAGVQAIMTAHVRVPALDDRPATHSAAIVGELLRKRLGFDGLLITDALEMRAVSGTVGLEEGAVRALIAGADALCLGHDVAADETERVLAALAARVPEPRLREAAERVRRVAAWVNPAPGTVDRGVGIAAARLALYAEGDLSLDGRPRVVELCPRANIAAGPASHSFPGAVRVHEGEPVPAAEILVVRDAHRHAWIRDAVERAGDVLVIEIGVPGRRPPRARGYVATRGGSRACLEAAAELLGGVRA